MQNEEKGHYDQARERIRNEQRTREEELSGSCGNGGAVQIARQEAEQKLADLDKDLDIRDPR